MDEDGPPALATVDEAEQVVRALEMLPLVFAGLSHLERLSLGVAEFFPGTLSTDDRVVDAFTQIARSIPNLKIFAPI